MKKTDQKVLEEIIRVDHAGERGAIKIYEGQLLALKTFKQDEDILYADNFIWNIEETNYLLGGNIRFENKNIILNSAKAMLDSDNIIEFFNPVKYIIKDDNNENKYEINSENAYYNLNTESVRFGAKDKRVRSIIYF